MPFTMNGNILIVFFSINEDRNCGGAAVLISKSFLANCLLCFPIHIVHGRIIAVLLIFPNVNLLYICVHNSPTWDSFDRHHYFKLVQKCVPDSLKVTTIICGDLNFSHDTIRFNDMLPDTTTTEYHKALARLWDVFFSDFIEVAHDCPTFMRGTYLSQLDHVWINVLPAILLDLHPTASVVWQFGDQFGSSSDHTPVRLTLGADIGNRVSSIPRWVPKHLDFHSNCLRLIEEVLIIPGSPYKTLQRHKAIIKEAARLTIKFAASSAISLDIDQRIYWSMILLRHRHNLSSLHVLSATKSYKHLAAFINTSTGVKLLDIRALSLHIDELQYSKFTGDIDDLPACNQDSEAHRVRVNRLGQYLNLWASRRRKITNLVIVDSNECLSHDASSGALMLKDHWAPRFLEKKVNLGTARRVIRQFIKPLTDNLDYIRSFDQFCDRISKLHDSGVGCDSFLYSCWRFCHNGARVALLQFLSSYV